MAGLGAETGVSDFSPSLSPGSRAGGELRMEILVFGMMPPPTGHFYSSQVSDAAFEFWTRNSACCETPPGNL